MMSSVIVSFFEETFYHPKWYHYLLSVLLLPLSVFYGIGMYIRRKISKPKSYGIPIISVGNLVMGGSGKTPFVISLVNHLKDRKVAVISRGHGRKSSGMVEVSRNGLIRCDVAQGGDEAMLVALSLPNASVIVSEDRSVAINLAQQNGAELIILDDGFNRVDIDKFEILLEPEVLENILPLPSGPFREFAFTKSSADLVLKDGIDYKREVSFETVTSKMVLVTAIANPKRLNSYLPDGLIDKIYLKDHAYFTKQELGRWLEKSGAESILVTEKDWVKMKDFGLPLSVMKLKLRLNDSIMPQIETYIKEFRP